MFWLWKHIEFPVIIFCCYVSCSFLWSYLFTVTIGLFNMVVFFKPFFTWGLGKMGCNLWASLVILSCVGEIVIFVTRILAQGRSFTRASQRYSFPVLSAHSWGFFYLGMALRNWADWLSSDSDAKIGEPRSSLKK